MNSARLILIALICSVPTTLLINGLVMQGLIAAVLAGGIFAVASSMRQGETDFLLTLMRPIVGVAIIPAVWMVFQVLPVGAVGLAHPIWQSAEQALGYSVGGSISIDPGATLVALGQYLCMVGIVILATAVAVDRERAEWILFALVIATALVAVVVIVNDAFALGLLDGDSETAGRAQARACVALGTIISVAAMIRTFERYETAKFHPDRSLVSLKQTFIGCAAAFSVCTIALLLNVNSNLLFVTAFGLGTLLAVFAIRHIGVGFWGSLAIATSAGLVAIVTIGIRLANRAADLTLAFASSTPTQADSLTQHILAASRWTGIGAGTFSSIVPIYRDAGSAGSGAAVPTAAAKIAIELGWPMLWGIVIVVMAAIVLLLRGALERGRDSFHAAAGAGSLVFILLLAFCDTGILGIPVGICSASIVGLAIAQRKSRLVS